MLFQMDKQIRLLSFRNFEAMLAHVSSPPKEVFSIKRITDREIQVELRRVIDGLMFAPRYAFFPLWHVESEMVIALDIKRTTGDPMAFEPILDCPVMVYLLASKTWTALIP